MINLKKLDYEIRANNEKISRASRILKLAILAGIDYKLIDINNYLKIGGKNEK